MFYPREMTGRPEALSLLVGLVLGVVAFAWLAESQAGFRPEDAGLGENTTSHFARYEGRSASSYIGTPEPVHATMRAMGEASRPLALWLGASQLHAINRFAEGDDLAVHYANEASAARGSTLYYVQLSEPNANLNELLVAYLEVRELALQPDLLILGLTYDDLREPGIRPAVVERVPAALDRWAQEMGSVGLANVQVAREEALQAQRQTLEILGDMEGTPQQRLEDFLTRKLEQIFPPYAHRGRLLAAAEVRAMEAFFLLRSEATQTRIPPIPPAEKAWNLSALDALVELCRRDGVELLVYKAPHRPEEPVFYHDRAAYDAFFEESVERFRQAGVHYRDLEGIVPAEDWGYMGSGLPDVFHFRSVGHRLLGSHVDSDVAELGF